MLAEKIILNEERNVTLHAYLHESSDEFKFVNRPAMMVIPGGGYAMCSDRTADVKNTLMFELALSEHDVPFESHIYSYGGHGFSTGQEWVCTNKICKRAKNWAEDSVEWLHELQGELTIKGFSDPDIAVSRNGDSAPVLSVNCSLTHLNHQNEAAKEVLQPMYDGIKAVSEQRGLSYEGVMAALGDTTARELLEMIGMSEDDVILIDRKLHGIVNRLYDE